jgi:PAS domain S-box-containing protein
VLILNFAKLPVNLSEKPYACILIRGCTELDLLEPQDIYSLGVFGTITGNALERAATRIALERSEQRYRSYIENAPNGILVVDENGNILESNAVSTLLFDLSADEIQLQNINILLNPEKLSGQFPNFTGLIQGERSQAEFIVTKDKSNLIIRAESVRLPDGNYLIFCSDITATRDMEKHLIHTERMVGIGEMATGIAHEINQPLNTISFGIDNLMHAISSKQADDNYIKEKSRKIFEGIHRMRTIIDHVRTFSRSNDDYINSVFSLNESIINALSLVNEQYKNQGIEISTNLSPDQDVSISGNTYKMEQVILNLLSNSRDALEEKKQQIKVPFTQTIDILSIGNLENIEITVRDNGNGIPSEHLEHITAPFYTTKEPGKGTGLGLAISYGIIREHDGEISFSSEPGKGTTVSLLFRRNLKTADK